MSTQQALTEERKKELTKILKDYEYDTIPHENCEIRRYENDIYIQYKDNKFINWFDLLEGVELYKNNQPEHKLAYKARKFQVSAIKDESYTTHIKKRNSDGDIYDEPVEHPKHLSIITYYEEDKYELWNDTEDKLLAYLSLFEMNQYLKTEGFHRTEEESREWYRAALSRETEETEPFREQRKQENKKVWDTAKYEYLSLQEANILNKKDENSSHNEIDDMQYAISIQLTKLRKILYPKYQGIHVKLAQLQQMSR